MNRAERFTRRDDPRYAPAEAEEFAAPSRLTLLLRRIAARGAQVRRFEIGLMIVLFAGTGAYGAVRGGHADAMFAAVEEICDGAASAAGFGITQVEIGGIDRLTHERVLEHAGVKPTSSLLLLDVDEVRAKLKSVPWISEASVRKFYPGRLEIGIEERTAFARWQREGVIHLIGRDGGVLESDVGAKGEDLPLVVGTGADKRAAGLMGLLDRFPAVRREFRAAVFVAERRWNLRLKNGIDIRLPEEDPTLALETLTALDRTRKIMSRDVTAIDLRDPGRVTVTLSDEAAAALEKQPENPKGANS